MEEKLLDIMAQYVVALIPYGTTQEGDLSIDTVTALAGILLRDTLTELNDIFELIGEKE